MLVKFSQADNPNVASRHAASSLVQAKKPTFTGYSTRKSATLDERYPPAGGATCVDQMRCYDRSRGESLKVSAVGFGGVAVRALRGLFFLADIRERLRRNEPERSEERRS